MDIASALTVRDSYRAVWLHQTPDLCYYTNSRLTYAASTPDTKVKVDEDEHVADDETGEFHMLHGAQHFAGTCCVPVLEHEPEYTTGDAHARL